MKKKKVSVISNREITQINSDVTYHDFMRGSIGESRLANPDSLNDESTNKFWPTVVPKLARLLIDEYMNEQGDFDILSPQENQVLRLYTSGQSLGQVALELKISKSSAVVYLKRAGNKLRKLLKPIENEI